VFAKSLSEITLKITTEFDLELDQFDDS